MDSKREEALVGLFVLIAAAVLLVTLFSLTGAFGRSATTYRTYFQYAGGLEPGATVRYAGGPKVGRVTMLRIDPQDDRRIEISFSVRPDVPVKSDSIVKVMNLSPLGENYLEISPGSPQAARARAGDAVPSQPYVSLNDLTAQLNALGPEVKELIETLNERAGDLRETVARVNDLLNAQNRANIAGSLSQVRGLLEENRPRLTSTMTNVDAASGKIGPLLDDFRASLKQADQAVGKLDAMLDENRTDLRQAIAELRRTLASTQLLVGQFDQTLNGNAENIDDILHNLRHMAENLKEFSEMIKIKPSLLIRSSSPPERRRP